MNSFIDPQISLINDFIKNTSKNSHNTFKNVSGARHYQLNIGLKISRSHDLI